MRRTSIALAFFAFSIAGFSYEALGQVANPSAHSTDRTLLLEPAWGTASETSYYIGGAAFRPAAVDFFIQDDGTGAAYLNSGGANAWAPINLPQGALITGYDFYFWDSSSAATIQCTLREVNSTGSFSAIGPLIGGGGKFCPDSPLTRGQMAVFLSVALGLHWPN